MEVYVTDLAIFLQEALELTDDLVSPAAVAAAATAAAMAHKLTDEERDRGREVVHADLARKKAGNSTAAESKQLARARAKTAVNLAIAAGTHVQKSGKLGTRTSGKSGKSLTREQKDRANFLRRMRRMH